MLLDVPEHFDHTRAGFGVRVVFRHGRHGLDFIGVLFEQVELIEKVAIEGRTVDHCSLADVAYGDLGKAFLDHQLHQRLLDQLARPPDAQILVSFDVLRHSGLHCRICNTRHGFDG